MAGRAFPPATGHRPAAQEHRAAGRPDLLRVVLWLGLLAFGALVLVVVAILPQVVFGQTPNAGPAEAGQGSGATVGGVTVTAPSCKSPQDPAPACAAQRLDQAAKAAAARGQAAAQTAPTVTVPDAQSPAATVGLGTPAAAAQQPGTPYGKPPGYVPPPPPGFSPGAGPFTRVTPR